MSRSLSALAVAFVSVTSSALASEGGHAVQFLPSTGNCVPNSAQTLGWRFNLEEPITVCAMTWFDDNQDGLELSHEVGIWDPSGDLILATNVVIPASTGAALDGSWRKVAIPPTTLPPGDGYIVGGLNGLHSDCTLADVNQFPNSAITYVEPMFGVTSTFSRPNFVSMASNGFYGASFQIDEDVPPIEDAVSFIPGSGNCVPNQPQTLGWRFDVLNPVKITRMAWLDNESDGLEIAHEVGIWAPDGTLIPETHVVIPAGAGAPLDGRWRVVTIDPVTLPTGQGYTIGGLNGVHFECVQASVLQVIHPDLVYGGDWFAPIGQGFTLPNIPGSEATGYYGASFQIEIEVGQPYCEPANPNSVSAQGGKLVSTGSYGTSAATFTITDIPNQPGLLYAGPFALDQPFGCGRRCVGGQVVRGSVVSASNNQIQTSFDMSLPGLDHIQFWYRDPANFVNCGETFNLTNALRP